MKKLIFFCASLALLAAYSAQAELINVPSDAVEWEGGEEPGDVTSGNSNMPADGASVDEYVEWMKQNMEEARRIWLIRYAKYYHPKGVKCLDFGPAHKFEPVGGSRTHYRFNCFAAPTGKQKLWPTHILDYEVKFSYQPFDCASDEDIRAHFNTESNRNKMGIKAKMHLIASSCALSIPSNNETKLRKGKLNPSKIDDLLNQDSNSDVQVFLEKNGYKKGVGTSDGGGEGSDCTNVLRCNKDSSAAD